MKPVLSATLFLTICVGCSGGGNDVVAEQDELAAYVAENPSPTTEELLQMNERMNGGSTDDE